MDLGISRNSWHYKYHQWLKRIWGLNANGEPKSLCNYCQLICSFSFCTAVCSVIMLIGWLELKFFRFCYKQLSKNKIGRKIVDGLDDKFSFGSFLETRSDNIESSPALSACGMFSIVGVALIIIAFIVCGSILGVGLLGMIIFSWIPYSVSYIWLSILCIGWGVFVIFAAIFFVSSNIIFWLGWLFKTIGLWFATNIITILSIIGTCILCLAGATVLVYLCMKFFQSKLGKKSVKYLVFKFNGFQSARQDVKDRRIEEEEEMTPRGPSVFQFLWGIICKLALAMWKFMKKIWSFLFSRSADIKIGKMEREIKIMGIFSLIWNFLVSLKQGVCPYVTFVDEEQIKEEVENND